MRCRNRTELVVSVDRHRVRIDDALVGVLVLAERLEFVRLVHCLRLPAVLVAVVHGDRLMLWPVQAGEQLLCNDDLLDVVVLVQVLQTGRRKKLAIVRTIVIVVRHCGRTLRLAVRVLLMGVMLVLLLALRRSLTDQTFGFEVRERQRGGQFVGVVATTEIEVRIVGVRVLKVAVIRTDRERTAVVQATHHAGATFGRLVRIGRICVSATRVTATRKRSLQ